MTRHEHSTRQCSPPLVTASTPVTRPSSVRTLVTRAFLLRTQPLSNHPVGAGLPKLTRAQARILELFDQGLNHFAFCLAEDRCANGLRQVQALDPLRGPVRPDLLARNPPDLLRVASENML